MIIYKAIKKRISLFIRRKKEVDSTTGYNLWASTYDQQPENLLIYLDKLVFDYTTRYLNFRNKVIVDIGCGTGRNWEKISARKPAEIIGYDVSIEMLNKLHEKYPNCKTHLINNNILAATENLSCDIIVSNLVIGHIKSLDAAFNEWNRVLKSNGTLIISDFHPDALQKGATCSFKLNNQCVLIKSYIHTLTKIRLLAKKYHWKEVSFIEKKVDDTIKSFYEQQNALNAFKESFGVSLLYAFEFQKDYITIPAIH